MAILGYWDTVGTDTQKTKYQTEYEEKLVLFCLFLCLFLLFHFPCNSHTHVSCLMRLYALLQRVVFYIYCIVSFWTMKFDISNLNNHPKENEYIYLAFEIQRSKSWYFVWFVCLFFFSLNAFKEINSLAVTLNRQVLSWMVFLFRHSFLRNPKNENNKMKLKKNKSRWTNTIRKNAKEMLLWKWSHILHWSDWIGRCWLPSYTLYIHKICWNDFQSKRPKDQNF